METASPTAQREAFTRSSIVQKFSIPAGGTNSMGAYGQTFYVLGANAPIEIKTDVTPSKPYRKGTGEEFPAELRFKRLEIKNPNAYAVTVEIWVGFGKYIDSRIEVQENNTVITSALPAGTIAALTTLTLSGSPTGNQIQRKNLIVSNVDTAAVLQILDENDDICAVVFPETSITLPISGVVKVRNNTGVIIACYVSEIWYYENAA